MKGEELELRLERLERDVRRWRTLTVVVVALLAGGAAWTSSMSPVKLSSADGQSEMTLASEGLVLRRAGKVQMALATTNAITALRLGPDDGKHLVLTPETLSFNNGEALRLSLASGVDKVSRGLLVYDDHDRPRAGFMLDAGGNPQMDLWGENPETKLIGKVNGEAIPFMALTRGIDKPQVLLMSGVESSGLVVQYVNAEAKLFMLPNGSPNVRLVSRMGKKLELSPMRKR